MDNTQHHNAFLTFRVGPFCLAVPAVDAEAIITMPEIRSVPLTPASISGVFSHRGKITVVISLKRKFGLKESDDRSAGQLIISRLNSGLKAFRVDEVLDIIPASGLNFSTLPAFGRITAFDKFAVKHDEIILRTDFELLFRLEESKEVADSLKNLTKTLKPEPDSDQPVSDEDVPISEPHSQTTPEENNGIEPPQHSDSGDSSQSDGNPADTHPEEVSAQKAGAVDKRALLKPNRRPVRKPIPYKARPAQRKTPNGYGLPPDRQDATQPPKRVLRLVVAAMVILGIIFASMIWLWPINDKDLKVAYGPVKPAENHSRDVFTQPPDFSQQEVTGDTSEIVADTVEVSEDKNDEPVKPEEPEAVEQIPLKTAEKTFETVEKDSADFTAPPKNKEILRIDTDDFTLTVERPQSSKTEPAVPPEQKTIDEDSPPLKTDEQFPRKTQQAPPEKTDQTNSAPAAAGNMEIIHIVVKGDTLWDISAKYLGDPFRYPELAKLSRINDPDLIYPGDLIRITKKKQTV
ncbi:MAG: chemotaxis protein CheW [Thermodesulfobacteriota bacterium]|nr:chemotaxis protein CheW [Thermodesulfobacteriota bacterium]